MSRHALAAIVAAALVAGLVPCAEARTARSTRPIRLKATDAEAYASGRVRFRMRHGATTMSATFSHLAPLTTHTVHWDANGEDGGTFVTDRHGHARLRRDAVPEGAIDGGPRMSILDEDGDPILSCDPDSMPRMHDGDDMHDGTSGDGGGTCPQECVDHCSDGGTCDAQCHEDHGCTDVCGCHGGTMDGSMDGHCGSGTGSGDTTDHASHHDDSGTDGGMMMGGGGMMSR